MAFLDENFLLHSDAARELYREHAAPLPIIDYHSHLPPEDLASDRRYRDLGELWLAHDHYKWRAMRASGVAEELVTGAAPAREKFQAWAQTVPHTLRNPIYHWTHLELRRVFGIEELLGPGTADSIWRAAREKLAEPGFSARGLLTRSGVEIVCTTDDPTSDLEAHRAIARSELQTRVLPTYRPDRALGVDQPERFRDWISALEAASELDCSGFAGFLAALDERHEAFHAAGCRLSDHGLARCPAVPLERAAAARIFDRALAGRGADAVEAEGFAWYLMGFFARRDHARGWAMQLHLGPLREVSTRLRRAFGPDAGGDTMGDFPQAQALARFLDGLDAEGVLPRTILYNHNPADNHLFSAMAGSFQDGSIAGKVQHGAAWWYLDSKDGIERHLDALSHVGLLSRFVGMLTDSRSLLSYCRHEYFRRVLCNLLGAELERGELPRDQALLGALVERVCYRNARDYFGFDR